MLIYKNVALRAIEETDLHVLLSWRNNEQLRRYFREYREFSRGQIKSWYDSMILNPQFEMFIMEDLQTNEAVGVAGLTYIDWVNRHADVHFYIGKNGEWIDNNYSNDAIKIVLNYGFERLNLNKLWAEIYEIDSKKLEFFKKLGFTIDASLREHYYYDGKYHTSHILSLLKSEYGNG